MRLSSILAYIALSLAVIAGLWYFYQWYQASKLATKAAGAKARSQEFQDMPEWKKQLYGWMN